MLPAKVSAKLLDEGMYDFALNGIAYRITSSTTVKVAGFTHDWYNLGDEVDVVIPEKVNGYTVTEVGANAFDNSYDMKSIKLPNTLQRIDDWAFCECYILKQIDIPDGVTHIGYCAFAACNSLESVRLPLKLIRIDPTAFDYCDDLRLAFNSSNTTVELNNAADIININDCFNPNDNPFEYTGLPHDIKLASNVNGYTLHTTDAQTEIEAGKYTAYMDITFTKGGFKATFERIPYEYIICKASLTISLKSTINRDYGEDSPGYEFRYTGFRNNENETVLTKLPTAECEANRYSDAGIYQIIISGAEAKNYDISYVAGVLAINKVPLTISINGTPSREYGEDDPEYEFMYEGFRNNDNETALTKLPTAKCEANKKSDVDLYPIILSGAEAKNYYITYITNVLKITKATLTFEVKNATKKYNEELPLFDITFKGFKNDDNMDVLITKPTISTKATKTSDVGTYEVKTTGGVAKNYNFEHKPGVLFIEKADQEITWNLPANKATAGDMIKLDAVASSGLEITYLSDDDNIAEVISVGTDIYLQCKQEGKVTITAQQLGDKNYLESEVLTHSIEVQTTTGINSIYGDNEEVDVFNLNGVKTGRKAKGINIIRYGNGKYKKVFVK